MAKYRAMVDCVIFGAYRPAGSEFEGLELEGYDKETATHLEVLDEEAPQKPAKGKKSAPAEDDL